MRLVIQRVSRASVAIEGRTVSGIGNGLLVLVGVDTGDTEEDMRWLVGKTVGLRIFNDENGVMNRSVVDVGGEVLAVSQFTLTASTKKGNRPSYIRAAGHDLAVPLYEKYCEEVSAAIGKPVVTSNLATAWACLRLCGDEAPRPELGRLMTLAYPGDVP